MCSASVCFDSRDEDKPNPTTCTHNTMCTPNMGGYSVVRREKERGREDCGGEVVVQKVRGEREERQRQMKDVE